MYPSYIHTRYTQPMIFFCIKLWYSHTHIIVMLTHVKGMLAFTNLPCGHSVFGQPNDLISIVIFLSSHWLISNYHTDIDCMNNRNNDFFPFVQVTTVTLSRATSLHPSEGDHMTCTVSLRTNLTWTILTIVYYILPRISHYQ